MARCRQDQWPRWDFPHCAVLDVGALSQPPDPPPAPTSRPRSARLCLDCPTAPGATLLQSIKARRCISHFPVEAPFGRQLRVRRSSGNLSSCLLVEQSVGHFHLLFEVAAMHDQFSRGIAGRRSSIPPHHGTPSSGRVLLCYVERWMISGMTWHARSRLPGARSPLRKYATQTTWHARERRTPLPFACG